MLTQENFYILKEIQSLFNNIEVHKKRVLDQQMRVDLIRREESLRKEKLVSDLEAREKLKESINRQENKLENVEIRLKKLEETYNQLKTQAQVQSHNNEKEDLLLKKDCLYETLIQKLDDLEVLEDNIESAQNFLSGINSSLSEIQNDANQEISKERKLILDFEDRIKNLLNECPPELSQLYQNTKKRTNPPLAYVKNDSCERCGAEINRQIQVNIDTFSKIERCPICARILIPSTIH